MEINNNLTIIDFLTSKKGLKFFSARKIILKMGLHESASFAQCSSEQRDILKTSIQKLKLDLLPKKQAYQIKKLQIMQSYKGTRHIKGLPVNGQRTHTNGRTQKYKVWLKTNLKQKFRS